MAYESSTARSALFGNPFVDAASAAMPLSTGAMLRHAEYFAVSQEMLRAAFVRMVAYFLTKIKIDGEMGDDERDVRKRVLEDEFGMFTFLLLYGLSGLAYGNAYASVITPFRRFLKCPRCGVEYSAKVVGERNNGKLSWDAQGMSARCPACRRQVTYGRKPPYLIDRVDRETLPRWRVWNPHDLEPAEWDEWTGRPLYYDWTLPGDYKSDIRSGRIGAVVNAPVEVLDAAVGTGRFRFADGYVCHWTDATLPGLRTRGTGVPRAITNYRGLYLNQAYRRGNEVLAMHHVTPFRNVSPTAAGGGGGEGSDVIRSMNLGFGRAQFQQMLDVHRRDPDAWHFSPYPLQYQALGADARQLTPRDLLDQSEAAVLNGIGMPVELYRASLATTASPFSIRLFERYGAPLFHGLSEAARFVSSRLCLSRAWQPFVARLVPPTLADDVERKQILFNLAQQQKLPWSDVTAELLDISYDEATKKRYEEQRTEAESQAEFQRDIQNLGVSAQVQAAPGPGQPQDPNAQAQGQGQGQPAGGGGGQPQPGQPPAGGPGGATGGPPQIPPVNQAIAATDLYGAAQAEAQYLADPTMAQTDRERRLTVIRQANPLYHKLVRQTLDELRSKARSAGQAQGMQQVLSGQ